MQGADWQRRGSVLKYVTESLGSRNAADEYFWDAFFHENFRVIPVSCTMFPGVKDASWPHQRRIKDVRERPWHVLVALLTCGRVVPSRFQARPGAVKRSPERVEFQCWLKKLIKKWLKNLEKGESLPYLCTRKTENSASGNEARKVVFCRVLEMLKR